MNMEKFNKPVLEDIIRKVGSAFGGKETERVDHQKTLESHIEYANTVHQHALDLHAAHVEGRIKEISAYHKLAKPGTPLQAQVGESSVSLVTREPKTRAPKAPAKPAPKPLPVRDPKSGRATKAPQ